VFANVAGDDIERVLERVETVAEVLLGDDVDPLPRFVQRAMSRCLDERS
jgi:hypothetical protein